MLAGNLILCPQKALRFALFIISFILFASVSGLSQPSPYQLIIPDLPTKDLKARSFTKLNDKLYFVSEYKFFSVDVASGTSEEITSPTIGFPYNGEINSVNGKLILGGANTYSIGSHATAFDPNTGDFTVLVTTNTSGPSNPQYFFQNNGFLYFTSYDGTTFHLWRTNGTPEGTIQLSTDTFFNGARYTSLGTSNLVLAKSSGSSYDRLYVTDGSVENTTLVKDFSVDVDPGRFSTHYENNYVVDQTSIVFVILRGSSREVWYSDGTIENTEMLFSLDNSVAFVDQLAVFDGGLYYNKYWSENGVTHSSLNKYDFDSEQSTEIKGFEGARVGEMHATDSYLLFTDEINMWATDGTTEGTLLLHDDLVPFGRVNEFLNMADGSVIFRGYSSENGGELWVSNGTAQGTTLIQDVFPGTTSAIPQSQDFPVQLFQDGILYLLLDSPDIGLEFWQSDGTIGGTHAVSDVNNILAEPSLISSAYNDHYLFAEIQGVSESDGYLLEENSAAFQKVPEDEHGMSVGRILSLGNDIFFSNNTNPKEIYKIDEAGSLETISFLESNQVDNVSDLYHVGGKLIFTGSVPTTPPFVEYLTFLSDGSPQNTYSIGSFYMGGAFFPETFGMLNENEMLLAGGDFFSANINGVELRKGGIVSGETSLLKDIIPGAGNSNPNNFHKFEGVLFFFTADENDEYHSKYLWKSDGTQDGTELVYDFGDSDGLKILSSGQNLIILASETYGSSDMSIYMSDGSSEGTQLLHSIGTHYFYNAVPYPIIQGDNYVIYLNNENFNYSLISIGPTLEEITLIPNCSPIKAYWKKDNLIFLMTSNGALYRTDGTVSGTVMIDDFFSTFDSNSVSGFGSFNDLLIVNLNKNSIKEIWAQSIFYSDIEVQQNTSTITSGDSYDFGVSAFDNEAITSYSFSIKNNGLINLNFAELVSLSISGPNATDFSVKNATFEDRIGPGQEGGLAIYFKPTGTGARSATLTLSTNDEDTPAFTILLTGEGVKASQSLVLNELANRTFGDNPFDLNGSASSGLPVTYTNNNNEILSIEGNIATILKAGEVVITASQPGNQNYEAATPVKQTLTINKASQSITFNILPEKTYGDPSFELSSTTSTGLPATFTSSNPAVVTVEGSEATILGAGSATITASLDGNDNYLPASTDQTITVNKAAQSITFDELPTLQADDAPFELAASATSGLPVSFVSQNESIAVVTGNTLTVVAAGETTVSALQQGNDNYLAAEEVMRTLVVEEVTGWPTELTERVKIYPNPTQSFIEVALPATTGSVEYQLTKINGEIVRDGVIIPGARKKSISIEDVPPGIYILSINGPTYSQTFRVIRN